MAFMTTLRTTCFQLLGVADERQLVVAGVGALDDDRRRRERLLLESEYIVDQRAELHRLAHRTARPRELEELGQHPAEPPDLVADDLRFLAQRHAGRVVDGQLVEVPAEQVQLQGRGVEGVADLVGQVEGEGAHRREGLGVGGALLEGPPLGDVDADAVDERRLVAAAARDIDRCQRTRRRAGVSRRALDEMVRAPRPGPMGSNHASISCVRPDRARVTASSTRALSSSGIQLSMNGRPTAPRRCADPRKEGRLAVEEDDAVLGVDADDQHVAVSSARAR